MKRIANIQAAAMAAITPPLIPPSRRSRLSLRMSLSSVAARRINCDKLELFLLLHCASRASFQAWNYLLLVSVGAQRFRNFLLLMRWDENYHLFILGAMSFGLPGSALSAHRNW
jgi:hypothetical protein